jgi:hypothetical protein
MPPHFLRFPFFDTVKRRTKIISVCAVIVTVLLIAPVIHWSLLDGKELVEKTRAELRTAGFKTELAEFNFSASLEDQARVSPLTNSGTAVGQRIMPDLMPLVGTDAAVVLWAQEKLPMDPGEAAVQSVVSYEGGGKYSPNGRRFLEQWLRDDVRPVLKHFFAGEREAMKNAADAALSGPIRFHLQAKNGSGMLLPHLAALKNHELTFGQAMVLELHDGNKAGAWTNLLAASRLVTAWEPEAVEISVLVRFTCANLAFKALWQGLRAGWTEEQLASLQKDWERLDFFKVLPETVAFLRAASAATIQTERENLSKQPIPFPQIFRTPGIAWSNVRSYQEQVSYRRLGTYQEEAEALLFYRDREAELRNAMKAGSWLTMRELPGATNLAAFQSRHSSTFSAFSSTRQILLATMMNRSPGGGRTSLARAADAEARRRIIVTAVALERYRVKHGTYPKKLAQLVPEFLGAELMDFMDGNPLRHRVTEDQSYVLYSVGLDCVDDGGVSRELVQDGPMFAAMAERTVERDLVWPRAASAMEITAFRKEQAAENARRAAQQAEQVAARAAEWRRRASNQVTLPENFE